MRVYPKAMAEGYYCLIYLVLLQQQLCFVELTLLKLGKQLKSLLKNFYCLKCISHFFEIHCNVEIDIGVESRVNAYTLIEMHYACLMFSNVEQAWSKIVADLYRFDPNFSQILKYLDSPINIFIFIGFDPLLILKSTS